MSELTDKQIVKMEKSGIAVCRCECEMCTRKLCTGAKALAAEAEAQS